MGKTEEFSLGLVDINAEKIEAIRIKMPVIDHFRPDIYYK